MDYVVFAIDNNKDLHTVAKFTRHIDTKRAMGGLNGDMVQCIGNWEGILEVSYIMRRDDYERYVLTGGFTKGQEAVMIAPRDNRLCASIVSFDMGHTFATLGAIREISVSEATHDVAWTFNTISGKYFTA